MSWEYRYMHLAGAYNGTSLVAKSDCGIVYVAIQYRLGLLGFLDVPRWEGPANLGFTDQLQALQWVQVVAALLKTSIH